METTIKTIVLGGGCFWCIEAVFKMLEGVISVTPGYTGGKISNPNYETVSLGKSGHAEVVKVDYDPKAVNFRDLLTVFFASHDPTQVNRQGTDIGEQYRSIILYKDEHQKNEAEKFIVELNTSHQDGKLVATKVLPLEIFYPAENYHRDYYDKNTSTPYCELVINPKLEKIQRDFAALLKNGEKIKI